MTQITTKQNVYSRNQSQQQNESSNKKYKCTLTKSLN